MRKETWDIELFSLIKSRRNTPFEWGKHDCTLFVADCILAMTGVDPAKEYRNYSTEQGAMLIVGKFGSLEKLVDSMLSRVDVKLAQRGDVVMIESLPGVTGKAALGICLGQSIVAASPSGIKTRDMSDAIHAWGVN